MTWRQKSVVDGDEKKNDTDVSVGRAKLYELVGTKRGSRLQDSMQNRKVSARVETQAPVVSKGLWCPEGFQKEWQEQDQQAEAGDSDQFTGTWGSACDSGNA